MYHVRLLIENRTVESIAKLQNALKSLEQEIGGNEVLHPSLDAIIHCFSSVSHAQTKLEASSTPALLKFLPMLEYLKQRTKVNLSFIHNCESKLEESPTRAHKIIGISNLTSNQQLQNT